MLWESGQVCGSGPGRLPSHAAQQQCYQCQGACVNRHAATSCANPLPPPAAGPCPAGYSHNGLHPPQLGSPPPPVPSPAVQLQQQASIHACVHQMCTLHPQAAHGAGRQQRGRQAQVVPAGGGGGRGEGGRRRRCWAWAMPQLALGLCRDALMWVHTAAAQWIGRQLASCAHTTVLLSPHTSLTTGRSPCLCRWRPAAHRHRCCRRRTRCRWRTLWARGQEEGRVNKLPCPVLRRAAPRAAPSCRIG